MTVWFECWTLTWRFQRSSSHLWGSVWMSACPCRVVVVRWTPSSVSSDWFMIVQAPLYTQQHAQGTYILFFVVSLCQTHTTLTYYVLWQEVRLKPKYTYQFTSVNSKKRQDLFLIFILEEQHIFLNGLWSFPELLDYCLRKNCNCNCEQENHHHYVWSDSLSSARLLWNSLARWHML